MTPGCAMVVGCLLTLLTGCATKPPPARRYATTTPAASVAAMTERLSALKTVRGDATITMTDAKGKSVRLDGVYLLSLPDRARLRAWKLGTAVFDLTIDGDKATAFLPREAARPATPAVRESMARWLDLIGGRGDLFDGDVSEVGDDLRVSRKTDDGNTLTCLIDRATLTPRVYALFAKDDADTPAFTLTLLEYRDAGGGQVWPHLIRAESRQGTIEIETSEADVNGELPEGAFTPPARAEPLP